MKLSCCSATLNIDDQSSKIASLLLSVLLPRYYRYAILLFTSCLAQNKLAPSFSNWTPKACLLFVQNLSQRCCWLSRPWGEQLSLRDTVVSELFDVKKNSYPPFPVWIPQDLFDDQHVAGNKFSSRFAFRFSSSLGRAVIVLRFRRFLTVQR